MKNLSQLITARKPQKTEIDDKTVFFIFERIVRYEYGQTGVVRVRPDYFNNGKLFVKTHSSAWASEILLDKEKILRKINKELGKKEVLEIVVRS